MEAGNRLKDMLNCYDWASHLRYVVGSTWKDTFEHFTELILLGIPEITELVASTVAGAFLARFGCLLSPTLDNNLWNVQFTCLDKKKASLFLCFSLCFLSLEESKNRVLWRSNQTCDIYPYLAIRPLRFEKSGLHMMRRSLTRILLWSYPLQRVGKSRCRSQRWRAMGMLMLPALLLVPENIRTTRNAEFVKMWKLWNFAHSTLPWPGERWHPWLISSEMQIWVEWFCPLWSYLVWHRCRCPGEGACGDIWTDEPQDE